MIFALSAVLLMAFLISSYYPFEDINKDYIVRGNFDSKLIEYNDVDKLDDFIRNQLLKQNIGPEDTTFIVDVLDSILQLRFSHGTARYNLKDNWIAFCLGKFFWDDLRMIVIPDHILSKSVTACNQMSIVFHRLLRLRNISYRAVGLNKHMVTEVMYGDKWYMYDPDYEPSLNHEMSINDLLNNKDEFQNIYKKTDGVHFNKNFQSLLETKSASYYKENIELAGNLRAFHYVSGFLSRYAWLLFALLGTFLHFFKSCVE